MLFLVRRERTHEIHFVPNRILYRDAAAAASKTMQKMKTGQEGEKVSPNPTAQFTSVAPSMHCTLHPLFLEHQQYQRKLSTHLSVRKKSNQRCNDCSSQKGCA